MAFRGPTKKYEPERGDSLQLSMFMPESDWKPPDMTSLPEWDGAKRICLDCETRDPDLKKLGPGPRRDGYTTGWGLAIDDGPSFYLPMRHEGGGNLDADSVLRYLRSQTKKFTGEIVGAKLDYDLDYALEDGMEFHPDVLFRDIQIADPLINELHYSYSLDAIGERVGVKAKDETMLIAAGQALGMDPKAGMWRFHSKYVGAYGEQDVRSPLEIYAKQRELLTRDNLWGVFDLESQVLPVLVRMRRRGVRIDFDKLNEIELMCMRTEKDALDIVLRATGIRIDREAVWKPAALAPALQDIGVRLQKTSQGAYSISNDLLERIQHPVAEAIRRARKFNKLRTTFASSMRKHAVNGKIHCTFHQIAREAEDGDQKGVRYGRLSATGPNLQQQPNPEKDEEVAGEWRKIFIPEDEAIWACVDFKQQEPKWVTHYAAVLDLPRAREAAQRFIDDPKVDNHDMMTELIHGEGSKARMDPKLFKQFRSHAKILFLGLTYGEGGAKLCHDLKLSTRWAIYQRGQPARYYDSRHEAWMSLDGQPHARIHEVAGLEGQAIIDKFNTEVPFVRKLAERAQERAAQNGFVNTISGRRLHFKTRDNGTYDWLHKAMNRVIQGTSADQMKQALVDIDRAGYYLQLQVHDESNSSVSTHAEAIEIGRIMSASANKFVEPRLPFSTDVECGPSWGEIKGVSI
jgi:DNA polymerase I-like protein with 3'-5' exonuclease and polymerase domains